MSPLLYSLWLQKYPYTLKTSLWKMRLQVYFHTSVIVVSWLISSSYFYPTWIIWKAKGPFIVQFYLHFGPKEDNTYANINTEHMFMYPPWCAKMVLRVLSTDHLFLQCFRLWLKNQEQSRRFHDTVVLVLIQWETLYFQVVEKGQNLVYL